jgi:hypothetical protein
MMETVLQYHGNGEMTQATLNLTAGVVLRTALATSKQRWNHLISVLQDSDVIPKLCQHTLPNLAVDWVIVNKQHIQSPRLWHRHRFWSCIAVSWCYWLRMYRGCSSWRLASWSWTWGLGATIPDYASSKVQLLLLVDNRTTATVDQWFRGDFVACQQPTIYWNGVTVP